METSIRSLGHLSDDELLVLVPRLAENEREATVSLIAHLAELDKRALYLELGYSSLFAYCTQVLHLSEPAAYFRIQATRAVQRFPVILEKLAEGSVHLTAVALLKRHLTEENHLELLEAARYRSKKEVEALVARIRPLPPVPSSVRKLPSPGTDADSTRSEGGPTVNPLESMVATSTPTGSAPGFGSPPRPAVVAPLAPERYKVQFTANAATYQKLCRARDLLRHQIPDGDPAAILDRALTVLLERLEKQKLAATAKPRPPQSVTAARSGDSGPDPGPGRSANRKKAHGSGSNSRHIPAEVKRTVWARDEGQCAYQSPEGRRCAERGRLEFHHVEPYAVGGPATIENIALRCRSHNAYEAEKAFGWKYPSQVRDQLRPDGVDGDGWHLGRWFMRDFV